MSPRLCFRGMASSLLVFQAHFWLNLGLNGRTLELFLCSEKAVKRLLCLWSFVTNLANYRVLSYFMREHYA